MTFPRFAGLLVSGMLVSACGSARDTDADSAAGQVAAADSAAPTAVTTDGTTVGATATATEQPSGALLDPNTATKQQLAAIPGFDPSLADSVLAKRPFADMRALDRVLAARLTEPQRDTVYARLFKRLDLNSATAEEIELIPGVGRRMRHEFQEYRPYTSIEQFRREIGKYVKQDEVARLEKYVMIKQ
jgi:DNA uptake protein ComE-like DNA-binding protein